MIIKSYNLQRNFNKEINFFLLYGNNRGLMDETLKNFFIPPIFSKNITRYEESEILGNIKIFEESIYNKSFFEDKKLIIISRASDKILKVLEEIIEKEVENLKIVILADILEKKSKLRNYFEKSKVTITIPFYEDNHQTLFLLTKKFLSEKKINISHQNINLIIEKSKGDRIHLKNELDKIDLYNLSKKKIDDDIILKLTNLAENYNISELVDNCLAQNKKKTLNILNENNTTQEDNILILKTFLFRLKRLKKIKMELNYQKDIDLVISSYKPPIFWKDKELLKQQLKILTLNQIKKLISEVNNLEFLVKKNILISNQITNNFVMESLESANN